MLKKEVLSFRVAGAFGAFRDPSVTSNQTVYYIPSKTSVIGMIGAILGVERGHGINETYSKQYLELFSNTKIGLELESKPEKVSFFTNHRSLKEPKTKPFKTELVVQPKYSVFVCSSTSNGYDITGRLFDAISVGRYEYPPYLGHAYCPATLTDPVIYQASEHNGLSYRTSSVILDESEPYDSSFALEEIEPDTETSSLIVERHLHHFMEGDQLKGRVLRHWIPELGSSFRVSMSKKPKLSQVVSLRADGRNHDQEDDNNNSDNNNNNRHHDNTKFVCLY